jgi:glycine/D-amino acid oxidase-like deaminating enzyme
MRKVLPTGKLGSIWNELKKPKKYQSLKKNLSVDVAIIGGGIAGINCAYMLKKRGYSVAVIEKNEIGQGTTAKTTAKITYGHGLIYNFLLKKFGFKKAKQYANANNIAIDKYEDIIKKEKIKCDFQRKDFYMFIKDKSEYKNLKDEFLSLRKIFLPVYFVEKIDLKEIVSAIKYPDQAQFHPLKYLYVLAEKIPVDVSYIL